MPFNPDEYLKAKGPAQAASPGFNPDSYMSDKKITAPSQPMASAGPSIPETIGNAASKGMSLGGLGRDIAPLVSAIFPTETDKAQGRDYFDRVLMDKKNQDHSAKASAEAHPYLSAIAEFASAIPKTVAGSGALKALGVGSNLAQGASLGGLEGLTQSKKNSLGETLADTGTGAAFGLGSTIALKGATSGLKKFIAELPNAGLGSAVDEFGNAINAAKKITATADKTGDITIKYGMGSKDAFKLGREMQATLADPNVQNQITKEANNVPIKLFGVEGTPDRGIVGNTMQSIGTTKDNLIAKYGTTPVNTAKPFETIFKTINAIEEGTNDKVATGKKFLEAKVKQLIENLQKASPDGTLENVPLKAVDAEKAALGKSIWEDGVFQGSGKVERVAKGIWNGVKDALQTADKNAGSGGDISHLDDVFSALYKMKSKPITGGTIVGLADPQNVGADKVFTNFTRAWGTLSNDLKQAYAPALNDYLTKEMPKTVAKAQIMKLVTGRGLQAKDGLLSQAAPSIFSALHSIGPANIANRLGATLGAEAPAAAPLALPSSLKAVNLGNMPAVLGAQLGTRQE